MITSDEPGVYRPGQWGVRIENLLLNVPARHRRERCLRRDAGVRDADAVPHRHALHRQGPDAARRGRLAQQPTTPRCANAWRRAWATRQTPTPWPGCCAAPSRCECTRQLGHRRRPGRHQDRGRAAGQRWRRALAPAHHHAQRPGLRRNPGRAVRPGAAGPNGGWCGGWCGGMCGRWCGGGGLPHHGGRGRAGQPDGGRPGEERQHQLPERPRPATRPAGPPGPAGGTGQRCQLPRPVGSHRRCRPGCAGGVCRHPGHRHRCGHRRGGPGVDRAQPPGR